MASAVDKQPAAARLHTVATAGCLSTTANRPPTPTPPAGTQPLPGGRSGSGGGGGASGGGRGPCRRRGRGRPAGRRRASGSRPRSPAPARRGAAAAPASGSRASRFTAPAPAHGARARSAQRAHVRTGRTATGRSANMAARRKSPAAQLPPPLIFTMCSIGQRVKRPRSPVRRLFWPHRRSRIERRSRLPLQRHALRPR